MCHQHLMESFVSFSAIVTLNKRQKGWFNRHVFMWTASMMNSIVCQTIKILFPYYIFHMIADKNEFNWFCFSFDPNRLRSIHSIVPSLWLGCSAVVQYNWSSLSGLCVNSRNWIKSESWWYTMAYLLGDLCNSIVDWTFFILLVQSYSILLVN